MNHFLFEEKTQSEINTNKTARKSKMLKQIRCKLAGTNALHCETVVEPLRKPHLWQVSLLLTTFVYVVIWAMQATTHFFT